MLPLCGHCAFGVYCPHKLGYFCKWGLVPLVPELIFHFLVILVSPLKYQMESNINLADVQALIFGIWHGTLIWEGQSWINWYWFDFAKHHHHHWQVSKVRPRAAREPKRPPPLFKAWAFSYKLYWQWTLFLDNLAKMPPNALGTWNITTLHFWL